MTNFRKNISKYLIVTDLVARGVDLPFVRLVIHFDFPQTMKTFVHRCGRTARANAMGSSVLLCGPSDQAYVFDIEK